MGSRGIRLENVRMRMSRGVALLFLLVSLAARPDELPRPLARSGAEPSEAAALDHPRVLLGSGDLSTLKGKIKAEPYRSMLESLITNAEKGQYGEMKKDDSWGESSNAIRCACLYALTGQDEWAKKARSYVEARLQATGKEGWANPGAFGLSLYFHGKAVAIAYDLCHPAPSWGPEFAGTVSKRLKEQADVIFEKGGGSQNNDPASNWQGNRFSSAGLCYLATDEDFPPERLDQCYQKCLRYLRENLGTGAGSRGWNIEGYGYTGYPLAHVGPFLLALSRREARYDPRKELPALEYAFWTLYAPVVHLNGQLAHPDFGDDNAGAMDNNGCLGMAFRFASPALLPGLKYWYERTVGTRGNRSFESDRGGTIFSLLYFPDQVEEKNPIDIPEWRKGFDDSGGNGFFTFRNQYRDSGDLLAQIYLKLRGAKGHNGPDALSFRILGLDTAWAVGGGRYGKKTGGQDAYLRSMNTVYPVDPDGKLEINKNAGKVVGTPLIRADGGGHVIGSIEVNNLGTRNHQRWFISDYSRSSGAEAVYVIGDTSQDGRFWQFCTLEGNRITPEGRSFTVTGKDGASLRGTVLYPPEGDLQWKTGLRIRGSDFQGDQNRFIHFQSGDGKFLVVLTVARAHQAHPAITSQGEGVERTVTVGGFSATLEKDAVTYGATRSK